MFSVHCFFAIFYKIVCNKDKHSAVDFNLCFINNSKLMVSSGRLFMVYVTFVYGCIMTMLPEIQGGEPQIYQAKLEHSLLTGTIQIQVFCQQHLEMLCEIP